MNKFFGYLRDDGQFVSIHPSQVIYGNGKNKYGQNRIPYEECPEYKKLKQSGLDVRIMDYKDHPKVVYPNHESKHQFYHENGQVKFDEKWEKRVMSVNVLIKKENEKLKKELDDELSKPSPNPMAVIKLDRNISDLKTWKKQPEKAYKRALERLDARVSQGKQDKPIIRQKLKSEISKISSGGGGDNNGPGDGKK